MFFEWFEPLVHCPSNDKLRVQENEEARKTPSPRVTRQRHHMIRGVRTILKLMLKEILVIEVPTMRRSCARSQKLRYNIAWASARQSRIQRIPARVYRCVRTFNISLLSLDFALARRKRKFYANCGKISRRRNRLIEGNAYGTSF